MNLAHFAIYKVLSGRNIFVNRNVYVFLPANNCVVTLVLATFYIIERCFACTTLILIILLAGLQNWKMQDEGAIATVNLSKLVV